METGPKSLSKQSHNAIEHGPRDLDSRALSIGLEWCVNLTYPCRFFRPRRIQSCKCTDKNRECLVFVQLALTSQTGEVAEHSSMSYN